MPFDGSAVTKGSTVYIEGGTHTTSIIKREVTKVTKTQIVITFQTGANSGYERRFARDTGIEIDASVSKWRRSRLVSAEAYAAHKAIRDREAKVHQLRATFRDAAERPLTELQPFLDQAQRLLTELLATGRHPETPTRPHERPRHVAVRGLDVCG